MVDMCQACGKLHDVLEEERETVGNIESVTYYCMYTGRSYTLHFKANKAPAEVQ